MYNISKNKRMHDGYEEEIDFVYLGEAMGGFGNLDSTMPDGDDKDDKNGSEE